MNKRESTNPFESLRKLAKTNSVKSQKKEPSVILLPVQLNSLNTIACPNTIHLIKLGAHEYLSFQGKAQVAAVMNCCQIGGFDLVGDASLKSAHFVPVYSPLSHSLITIKPIIIDAPELKENNATHEELQEIKDNLKKWKDLDNYTVIAIKPLHDGLDGISKTMPNFKNLFSNKICDSTPKYISVSLDDTSLLLAEKDSNTLESILEENNQIVCVVGNVNSGKSATARYLLHRYLSKFPKIAYLECDLGQPEFTAPGMVSLQLVQEPLLGPPFTHLRVPYYGTYLGFTSPKNDPDRYMQALFELITIYRAELSHIPLIVNTCGWTKGVGYDILNHFIHNLNPSKIIMMNLPEASKNFEVQSHGIPVENMTLVSDTILQKIKLNGGDLRNLQTISYFFQQSHCSWNFDVPFSSKPPYKVSWSHFRILFTSDDVPFSQALVALNGTIVGLGIDNTIYHTNSKQTTLGFIPSQCVLKANCIGLGLIRAIDIEAECFYILTPVSLDILSSVNVLLRGSFECPPALVNHGYERAHLPYTTFMNAEGAGSTAMKARHIGRKKMQ